MKFSVIVVCLNPGEKLKYTMDSILGQTYRDFEVIIKDGGSRDDSVEPWKRGAETGGVPVRLFQEADKGIYDAMNQAVSRAEGEFVLFMNCGDAFYSSEVLERTESAIAVQEAAGLDLGRLVLYGDIHNDKTNTKVAAPPSITGFTCYRNIPCHQSCIYSTSLCREKPFDTQYRIRADYDHFLWCFYRAGARFVHMGFPVASYEGGGYSESRENRERNKKEHRMVTEVYMGKGELFRYRAIMACTLAPLRTAMAESKAFAGVYQWVKGRIYQGKNDNKG